jgi:hypothetical protein
LEKKIQDSHTFTDKFHQILKEEIKTFSKRKRRKEHFPKSFYEIIITLYQIQAKRLPRSGREEEGRT